MIVITGRNAIVLLAAAVLAVAQVHVAHAASLLVDLPWSDLESMLSPSASLIDTSPANYVEECYPEFQKPIWERSHHSLIDQPSGLCMNQQYCAFDRCNPDPDSQFNTTLLERWDAILRSPTLETDLQSWQDPSNPSYNLPPKVLFPAVAGDVVAAVRFAKEHGLEISVKNSGHSYTGASTKKDTLLVNMNRYQHYAPTGVVECASDSDEEFQPEDLGDQPCRLATARGKPAALRVGGGENFDKSYRAVRAFNEMQEGGFKYHMVGGAAGTVSPMGWTWQGGLSGTTGGRIYGFGVDQVLQIEMVLPNGQHVRFGPTEWENDEDYTYPRTTSVSGVCNENPTKENDETQWNWAPCPDDANINFDDLWFAVRGGGGGTWGIVTSVHLQLHDILPLELIEFTLFDKLVQCGVPFFDPITNDVSDLHFETIGAAYSNFNIDFFLNPSAVGVTDLESNSCGAPGAGPSTIIAYCYGEGSAEAYNSAWKRHMSSMNSTFVAAGIPIEEIDAAANCIDSAGLITVDFKDYVDDTLNTEGPYAGQVGDSPPPLDSSTTEDTATFILPKSWVIENRDTMMTYLFELTAYWAFGGDTKIAQDQANSLSEAHRTGGIMVFLPLDFLTDSFFTEVFPTMYDTSDRTNFPGFIGSNHAGPNMRGPLKDDWTKACPLDWTQEKRDDQCISLQESIWGTKTLKRLESIKEAIDPNYMFDCYGCIGPKKKKIKKKVESKVAKTTVKKMEEKTEKKTEKKTEQKSVQKKENKATRSNPPRGTRK